MCIVVIQLHACNTLDYSACRCTVQWYWIEVRKGLRPKRRCISVRGKEGQAVLANESLCMRKAMHMLQLLVAFASAHNQPLAL